MKYYIIAGEASGDLHASNLIREIRKLHPDATFRAWGGDMMKTAGAEVVKHIRDLAFMGFAEVLMNLRTIFRNIEFCRKDILQFKPDRVILVDYPGFNLRIAKFLKAQNIPAYYYISPQVWAWKAGRVHAIKENVHRMITILPFEKEFYKGYGMEVDYVGHPLLDVISGSPDETRTVNKQIALLPGSRKQEIEAKLPLMIKTGSRFPDYTFVIAGAPSIPEKMYHDIAGGKYEVTYGKTYEVLRGSAAALVTSGTATLETALLGVPEVVCYKGNPISFAIAKRIVNVKFISLVNLIMDREVVKELIQSDLTVENMERELRKVLEPTHRGWLRDQYAQLQTRLGGPGASARAAKIICE